jgi:hypothetical protein
VFETFCHISKSISPNDLSVNALCSAGCAESTTLAIIQFARISVWNILSFLKNQWVNRPECQRAVLSKLRCAEYTVVSSSCKNKVLNILSYLKNYWANRLECQRVVLNRFRCAEYTVVSSICKNKFLNILSYLKNYWGNRLECQRVVLYRLRCVDYIDNYSICKNKCLKHFVISHKLLGQSTWVWMRCAQKVWLSRRHWQLFNLQE